MKKQRWTRRKEAQLINAVAVIFVLGLFFAILIFFSGCKTKYIPVEIEKIRDHYQTLWQRDSIYFADTLKIVKNGDTVFITNVKYRYLNKIRTDTVIKNDTVKVTKTETVTVTKPLKWYERFPMILGWLAIGGIGWYLFLQIKKLFK